jgi:hypothetical protein
VELKEGKAKPGYEGSILENTGSSCQKLREVNKRLSQKEDTAIVNTNKSTKVYHPHSYCFVAATFF